MKRSLKITERQVNGQMYYRVRGTLNCKRYESTFKDLEFAEEWKDTKEAEAKTNGMNAHFTWLTRKQINEAEVSFNRLGNRSLSEAIDYFLKNYNPATTRKGLVDAYIEFLGSRENANARPLTINNLRLRVGALVDGHPEMDVHEVTVADVKAFLAKPWLSAVSVSNYRRALHAFFNWCVKQEYCSQNPVAKIEPVKVDR